MLRYRLRTLLVLLAICPALLWFGWGKYQAWKAEQAKRAASVRQGPTPIAVDFAFPMTPTLPAKPPATSEQEFSFFIGITR